MEKNQADDQVARLLIALYIAPVFLLKVYNKQKAPCEAKNLISAY
jgi:hypothetical protein